MSQPLFDDVISKVKVKNSWEKFQCIFDGLSVVAARITDENLQLHTTAQALSKYPIWLVSDEKSKQGKLHQHILVAGPTANQPELFADIKLCYPKLSGNKNIYTKKALNEKQLLKYTVKEGNYLSSGISKDVLDLAFSLSISKDNMKKEFGDLEDECKLGLIPFADFGEKYVLLKIKYSQNLYRSHIKAYFTRMAILHPEVNVSARSFSGGIINEIILD